MTHEIHMIYFARERHNRLFKIGRTRSDLCMRAACIRSQEGLKHQARIEYAFATTDKWAERAMHCFLYEYRVRGEWFSIHSGHIEAGILAWLQHGREMINFQVNKRGNVVRRPEGPPAYGKLADVLRRNPLKGTSGHRQRKTA